VLRTTSCPAARFASRRTCSRNVRTQAGISASAEGGLTHEHHQCSDAPLPSVPEPVDGLPVPLPGDVIVAPSMPEPSAMELDMRAVKAELAELIVKHAALVTHFRNAPKVTRIEQLRAYIKAAPGV
jgi:hypothetical protein